MRHRRVWEPVLVGAFLLIACSATAGEAELDFTKGQSAFQSGDYHQALRHFNAAREADPADPTYAHWQGAALLRLGRYAEAVASLEEARELAGRGGLPGLRYDLGVAYYHADRHAEAQDLLRQALAEEGSGPRARFFLALSLQKSGQSEEAIRELKKVRAADPRMAEEVGLVLGRIYAETGRTREAAEELRLAAERGGEAVARISRDYLREIATEPGGAPKRWLFSGYSSIEYDTNVVLNPNDPGVDFPVSDSEDFRAEFWGAFEWNPVSKPTTTFGLGYGFYQTLHQDLTEFDFQGHLPDLHFRWSNGRHGYQGSAGYQRYDLDSDRYLGRWEVTNSYFLMQGRSGRTRFYHRYRDDEFFQVPERDGREHFVGVTQSLFPWQTKRRSVDVGVGYGDREAGNDYTYKTRTLDASFFSPVGEAWNLLAAFLYSNFDYENPDSVFEVLREDDEWEMAVRATYTLSEHWNLISEYRFTEHRSNIDFFDYDRHVLALGVSTVY